MSYYYLILYHYITYPQMRPIMVSRSDKIEKRYRQSVKKGIKNSIMTTVYAIIFIKQVKKHIKKSKHRMHVLTEWHNTEKSYNTDLKLSLSHIRTPMLSMNLIDNVEAQTVLFPEFEGMIQLSELMVGSLGDAKKRANPNMIFIGKDISCFVSGYKLYGGYFGNHSNSEKVLAKLSRDNEAKMKEIEHGLQSAAKKINERKENMTIKDCMEQPLYRLFKYVLLFKEYTKKLPKSHPDYEPCMNAMKIFHEINTQNNQLMEKIEERDKRIKLHSLYPRALKEGRSLITKMLADTIYFNAKIYIFNDVLVITKLQSILGSEKEEFHMEIQYDEFSYLALQNDLKYFKNFLILVGKEQCIHFFFADEGSRFELYRCLKKIFREVLIKAHERRKLEGDQKEKMQKAKKITFISLENNSQLLFEPEFRAQIQGIEVRPLSMISNDTVYLTRFMIPYYYQDEVNFLEGEGFNNVHNFSNDQVSSPKKKHAFSKMPFGGKNQTADDDDIETNTNLQTDFKSVNQRIEVHFSVLQDIYKEMREICRDVLPDIDPITKDVNIYSKGKKKTRSFQTRKFFIEEFFNFVFRHPDICRSPIRFIQRLRINQSLWSYVIERNQILKNTPKKDEKTFGYDHCKNCAKGKIKSLEQFEHYRSYYCLLRKNKEKVDKQKYCFNLFNLMRMRILAFHYFSFNNLERVLTYYHYVEGRLDYPFLRHNSNDKIVKVIKVYLPSLEDNYVSVMLDSRMTAGQIVDDLCKDFEINLGFDFELIATYSGKTRILDRDEFVDDLIKVLDIEFEEVAADKKLNIEKKEGFFSSIKKWGSELFSSQQKNRLYFMKVSYLYKPLELQSFKNLSQKRELEVNKIFWSVKKGNISLNEKEAIQICSLFYCLKQLDGIHHFTANKMSNKVIERILPDYFSHQWSNKEGFRKEIAMAIEEKKKVLISNNKKTDRMHLRVIDVVSDKTEYITYFLSVDVRDVPKGLVAGNQVPVSCLIGINYKEFVMTKSEMSITPIIKLELDDIEFTHSVFSVFINSDKGAFRFDSKMLQHFCELMHKYKVLRKQFPQFR